MQYSLIHWIFFLKIYIRKKSYDKCRRIGVGRFPSVSLSSRSSTSKNWRTSFRAPTRTCGKLCICKNVRSLCSHCVWFRFAIKGTPCTGWNTIIIHINYLRVLRGSLRRGSRMPRGRATAGTQSTTKRNTRQNPRGRVKNRGKETAQ